MLFTAILRNCFLYRFTTKYLKYNYLTVLQNFNKRACKPIIVKFYAKNNIPHEFLLFSSLLTWLGLKKEDEDKESELIMTIKRSVLCMQRNELVKAEQMLHIALRLAQEQKNKDGITYVYDLMANLAMERSQFEKSEKLFVNVLQRLLSEGLLQDDLKVIHICLKLARISQMKQDYEKAQIGYLFCLDSIKRHLNNTDGVNLNGIIQDWYAQFLSEKGDYKESLKYLEEAYKINTELNGENSEKSILLLNDMGTVNTQLGNYNDANEYLTKALVSGKKIDDFPHLATIYVNLGLVKIRKGLLAEAEKHCRDGWRIARKENDSEVLGQANYCFQKLRSVKSSAAFTNFGA